MPNAVSEYRCPASGRECKSGAEAGDHSNTDDGRCPRTYNKVAGAAVKGDAAADVT